MKSLTIIIAVSMLVSPVSGAPTHEKRGKIVVFLKGFNRTNTSSQWRV